MTGNDNESTNSGHIMKSYPIAAIVACLLTAPAFACEISSGPQTTALIELYTSEGCNSCPPADQWFSRYGKASTSNSAVWLAFHVDYWDYIGWKDRFASRRFGERQSNLVANGGGRTVYTPQIFINGHDASWRSSNVSDTIAAINRRPAEARLTLKLEPATADKWNVALTGTIKQPRSSQQIWIAVYEDGLSSDVRAGENSGVKLHHDRVVRQWLGPFKADGSGLIKVTQQLGGAFDATQSGVAAFVQDFATGSILQSVALPFCKSS